MKAYLINPTAGENPFIVFAETRAKALKYFNTVLDCIRYSEFDQYAPGPVPAEAYIKAGWRVECFGCYVVLDEDLEDIDGDPLNPVYRGDEVYCSEHCLNSYLDAQAKNQEGRAAVLKAAMEAYPLGTDFTGYAISGDRFQASFRFGGHSHAYWNMGDDHVSISRIDHDKWWAFKAENDKKLKEIESQSARLQPPQK